MSETRSALDLEEPNSLTPRFDQGLLTGYLTRQGLFRNSNFATEYLALLTRKEFIQILNLWHYKVLQVYFQRQVGLVAEKQRIFKKRLTKCYVAIITSHNRKIEEAFSLSIFLFGYLIVQTLYNDFPGRRKAITPDLAIKVYVLLFKVTNGILPSMVYIHSEIKRIFAKSYMHFIESSKNEYQTASKQDFLGEPVLNVVAHTPDQLEVAQILQLVKPPPRRKRQEVNYTNETSHKKISETHASIPKQFYHANQTSSTVNSLLSSSKKHSSITKLHINKRHYFLISDGSGQPIKEERRRSTKGRSKFEEALQSNKKFMEQLVQRGKVYDQARLKMSSGIKQRHMFSKCSTSFKQEKRIRSQKVLIQDASLMFAQARPVVNQSVRSMQKFSQYFRSKDDDRANQGLSNEQDLSNKRFRIELRKTLVRFKQHKQEIKNMLTYFRRPELCSFQSVGLSGLDSQVDKDVHKPAGERKSFSIKL